MSRSGAVIEAKHLGRDFGRRRALGPVDLSVQGGRVVALIGPNGAGKTTLLRLVMGLIEPTQGQAWLLGHGSRRLPAEKQGLVSFVGDGAQPPALVRIRSLMRLQAAGATWFNRNLATNLLAERGLSPKRRYGFLSKGQRRWVLTSLALASRTEVLIFDEPADGLDPAARRRLYDLLREDVNRRGSTVLIATHILTDVERVADEVVVLHHGLIRLHEDLETLREQVREIEMPTTRRFATPPAPVEVIARWLDHDTRRLLVRGRAEVLDRVHEHFGHEARVRAVDLETLYTSLTQPPTDNANDGDTGELLQCV